MHKSKILTLWLNEDGSMSYELLKGCEVAALNYLETIIMEIEQTSNITKYNLGPFEIPIEGSKVIH